MNPGSCVVVLLVGPQAAGKSTLAVALSAELRRLGEVVASVELDQIATMALPTLPSWDDAARIFALVAREWAGTDRMTCVVAEGISSHEEISTFAAHVPPGATLLTVAVTTSFDAAWVRAQADPTRGLSREHGFLADRYAWWSNQLPRIDVDLLIDTSAIPVGQGVRLIVERLDALHSR